jgi:D-3-phosphoglycerate dehydrogenase
VTIRILNAEPAGYCEEARRVLAQLGEVVDGPVRQDELANAARDCDVLIVRLGLRVTREVLTAAPRVRTIVSATTGLDHIDTAAAAELGVTVLSLRGETAFLRSVTSTAEHTWALLLALARRIPAASASVGAGGWDRDAFRGRELSGRRLGLLGLGRVGEQVARYGRAFGMTVTAHDPHRTGWVRGVQRAGTLDDLLAQSEILSIHVHLDETTRGLLDEVRLKTLPSGAWLVNTSRGAIVDEAALVALLRDGHLGGAALDVLEGEGDTAARAASPALAYARAHDNLVLTPHLGGATSDAMRKTEVFMAQKLGRHMRGRRRR